MAEGEELKSNPLPYPSLVGIVELQVESEIRSGGFEHPQGFRDELHADPIAWNDRDPIGLFQWLASTFGRSKRPLEAQLPRGSVSCWPPASTEGDEGSPRAALDCGLPAAIPHSWQKWRTTISPPN